MTNMRVLFVENNPDDYEAIVSIFNARLWKVSSAHLALSEVAMAQIHKRYNFHFESVVARCKKEADAALNAYYFNVVVVDLSIPKTRKGREAMKVGFSLIAEARRKYCDAGIIATSIHEFSENTSRFIGMQIDGFVTKVYPFADTAEEYMKAIICAYYKSLVVRDKAVAELLNAHKLAQRNVHLRSSLTSASCKVGATLSSISVGVDEIFKRRGAQQEERQLFTQVRANIVKCRRELERMSAELEEMRLDDGRIGGEAIEKEITGIHAKLRLLFEKKEQSVVISNDSQYPPSPFTLFREDFENLITEVFWFVHEKAALGAGAELSLSYVEEEPSSKFSICCVFDCESGAVLCDDDTATIGKIMATMGQGERPKAEIGPDGRGLLALTLSPLPRNE